MAMEVFSALIALQILAALSGGDWVVLMAAIIGSSGLGGIVSSYVGLRRLNIDEEQVAITATTAARTVAAQEAESAMKVMGETLARSDIENKRLVERIERCEAKCIECNERWFEHSLLCPLL